MDAISFVDISHSAQRFEGEGVYDVALCADRIALVRAVV
jgi:hypothetical protein